MATEKAPEWSLFAFWNIIQTNGLTESKGIFLSFGFVRFKYNKNQRVIGSVMLPFAK